MEEEKTNSILPCSDPLGLNDVVLGGAPPSLFVEAEIAHRQWHSNNCKNDKGVIDERAKKEN